MVVDLLFPLPESDPERRLQALYDGLASSFGFGAAVVRLSRRKLTGGEIRYGSPHRITISEHLSPGEQEDTLRHEAAHAWAYRLDGPRAGHGRLFRRLASRLGARPGHAPMTAALKEHRERRLVVYRCEGCGRLFRRFRPFRGARHCVACDRAGRPSRLRRLAPER
jgi:predicted SprT family Zn-dependent metalloprotease